ncbi:hypothetical protein [Pseudomonas sp. MC6]|jgi:hypothetical protein
MGSSEQDYPKLKIVGAVLENGSWILRLKDVDDPVYVILGSYPNPRVGDRVEFELILLTGTERYPREITEDNLGKALLFEIPKSKLTASIARLWYSINGNPYTDPLDLRVIQ